MILFHTSWRMEDDNGIALIDKAETMPNGGTWEKILAINLLMDYFSI